jgi:hypothetical protein
MLIKSLLCFFLISCVFSQLPGLYTRNKQGLAKNILNKHSGRHDFTLTKQYNGGIYVCKQHIVNNRNHYIMTPLHKRMIPNHLSPKAQDPGRIDAKFNGGQPRFNILYTRKKNGYYTPILYKNDQWSKRYRGGIYYKTHGKEIGIKPPEQNYFNYQRLPKANVIIPGA